VGCNAPRYTIDVDGTINAATNIFVNGFAVLTEGGGGSVTPDNLASTVRGLGTATYISTPSLTSTVQGLGSSRYISTFSNVPFISAQRLLASSIGVGCNAPRYTIDVNGTINAATDIFVNNIRVLTEGGGGSVTPDNLASTVQGLGSSRYISTLSNVSNVSAMTIVSCNIHINCNVITGYNLNVNGFSFFKVELPKKEDKTKSKRDYSYNVRQSKISIGAGRWAGNGFNNGTQTKAKLVPEQHTDFIFCTVGEEYGFIGSVLFIGLYLFFIGRIFYLAERQKNTFSRVFGYSTGSIILFHFFINIGMAMGLLPVIGIPLPFMSYGGSSLISFSLMLFTFLKLDANRVNELSRFS
jgi:hypothetical protein